MSNATLKLDPAANIGNFDRPLQLTARQDIAGFLCRKIGKFLLFALTCASVLAVFLIFIFIISEASSFLTFRRLGEMLSSTKWTPEGLHPQFGALAIICGSLYVTVGALLLAVPAGVMSALFLSDVAPFSLKQVVKPIIEILAAIPSVAYGFFAVMVLAPWLQEHMHLSTGTNALNASMILAIMAIPTIVSVSEDSLSAIGRDLREGSYALGATRAETLMKVVIPAAGRGITTAILLGMMRAIGETMVVWMASGNATQIPTPWWDITQSVRTMTATIAGDMGETAKGSDHYHALFAMGAMLLTFTLIINLIGETLLASKRGKH